ncbi:MAG: EamA family transporter [Pseudomonadota bacterium]
MSLWIVFTLAAATFQTLRFMLQKTLASGALSAGGATFARFLYSAPLVAVLLVLYLARTGHALPAMPLSFWLYGMAGGAAQILATVFVVILFKSRNFAVGITFKKTEVIQTVLVGLIVLDEGVTFTGFLFILIGLIGVLLLSDPPEGGDGPIWKRMGNRAVALGLGSGVFFAISGVSYRGASLSLGLNNPLFSAGVTLAAVTMMQMVAMALWLRLREPGEITRVWDARRTASLVGLTSMAGSYCWFTAFTLQNAAYVNALGQVELILSLLASTLFFREKITAREYLGIAVLAVSILGLIFVLR